MSQERGLTLEDILSQAQCLQLEISQRTFRYYAVLGLLPAPLERSADAEDARVHRYHPSIMERLQRIRSLQDEGFTLKQVKTLLSSKTQEAQVSEVGTTPNNIWLPLRLRAEAVTADSASVEMAKTWLVEVLSQMEGGRSPSQAAVDLRKLSTFLELLQSRLLHDRKTFQGAE